MGAACPNCGLIFHDNTSVLKHMNHRFSSCHIWFTRDSPSPPDTPPPDTPPSNYFPGAGHVFGSGPGFLGWFQGDTNAGARSANLYYPFLSKGEWEIAAFLSRSGLSMKLIDEFLTLSLITGLDLSFHCARTLRGKVELLPSGPAWKSTIVTMPGYSTKDPLVLYYRDPIASIEFLLKNPLFSEHIQFTPRQDFDSSGHRMYGDWITSNGAWELQSRLPLNATLLGVTLSSDKTKLSAMTGDRVAHPLLITLANIDSAVRLSPSTHALPLLALLPVPKFVGVKKGLHGILENRLTHSCLDFITDPLKIASQSGTWLSDYAGNIRYCFTPLVACIVDTPEAAALAGVAGKTSHLTMATYKEFGDPIQHPPRTASSILTSLQTLASQFNPSEVATYTSKARSLFRLNGVNLPFWRDWYLPDGTLPNPHQIFPIEILHHLHKAFWDHDVKWIIRAAGDRELDLRFSLLQPRGGYRHFSSGISSLKQVTGREHRDIQRYVLGLIPDGVDVRFILSVRALLDLRYLSQLHQVTERDLHAISTALQLFHTYKQVILDLHLRVGKRGPIRHFEIPKLELLQSITSCIQWSGSLPQWSADVTEHLHVVYIKKPRENTNGRDYPPQICHNLDRQEKCWYFDLATRLQEAAISTNPHMVDDPDRIFDAQTSDDEDWKSELPHVAQAFGPPRPTPNLFAAADDSQSQPDPPCFPRTFATASTAFHLNVRADLSRSTIGATSIKYKIPDLLQATRDFFSHFLRDQNTRTVAGKRGPLWDADVPFEEIRVWHSVRVQSHSQLCPGTITPPQKLFASPPSKEWPTGRCDTAIFAIDPTAAPPRPPPGLDGFFVGQIRAIFHPLWDLHTALPLYLVYVQRFDIVPQTHLPRGQRSAPDPVRGMYTLRRAYRSDGLPMGAIVPLYHLHRPVQLIPRFGAQANPALTSQTSFDASRDFFLNHYFDKEDFFYMRDSLAMSL